MKFFKRLRTKGQTELSEFMLKLIATILFTVFLVAGILAITQFKVQVNDNISKRLAIDFGESVLAAPCLAEKKGVFDETRLDSEARYSLNNTGDTDGISCLDSSVLAAARIETGGGKWLFGSDSLKSSLNEASSRLEFPAALNDSEGRIIPARLYIAISAQGACSSGNNGLNCYSCLDKLKCEDEGCKWVDGTCKY